ncbi:hypothetical protein TNCV_2627181 [Trichonephila clavipes]|uniref:Uncharacterized protein n=1 Tax=Trichonephila clavipes TaxID=2585209 RepID=A0A8X6W780_TRICX|nr:hypothetical protein TNCV_2627181 [Trichonephila clavipes]
MFDPSSFVNPTPLAHADASRDVLPRGSKFSREEQQFGIDTEFFRWKCGKFISPQNVSAVDRPLPIDRKENRNLTFEWKGLFSFLSSVEVWKPCFVEKKLQQSSM